MSDDDNERLWNLLIFKMYMTNRERDEVFEWLAPIALVAVLILVVVVTVACAIC